MEKKGHIQLELFSQIKGGSVATTQSRHSFFGFIWNYEKAILVVVGFIITSTIAFALGVEKGKKMTAKNAALGAFMASGVTQNTKVIENKQQPQVKKEAELKLAPAVREVEPIAVPALMVKDLASYTIQVASFSNKTSAQKEIQILQKKGLVASVLSKGKYIIVCVGKFMEKDQAKTLLSELKKRYQDCFIRRL